jgi:hypothetical protein
VVQVPLDILRHRRRSLVALARVIRERLERHHVEITPELLSEFLSRRAATGSRSVR